MSILEYLGEKLGVGTPVPQNFYDCYDKSEKELIKLKKQYIGVTGTTKKTQDKRQICEKIIKKVEAGKRAREEAEREDRLAKYGIVKKRSGGEGDYSRENPRRSPRLAVLMRKKEEEKKKALSPRTKAKKGKKKRS
jgi:hypothetical protein